MTTNLVSENYDYLYKMVVIGDSGVGKTNLLSRFATNEFSQYSKPTIGVEFATKSIEIQNNKIKVQVWDTAGQERFRAITHAYYKGATGALLVFDITRRNSYENLAKWLKELKENSDEGIVCILVGNKSDLHEQRSVRQDEVAEFAQQNKLFYLETSALQATNVDKAFMTVIKQIFQHNKRKQKTILQSKPSSVVPNLARGTSNNVVLEPSGKGKDKANKKKKCCE